MLQKWKKRNLDADHLVYMERQRTLRSELVPGAGVEPARALRPFGF